MDQQGAPEEQDQATPIFSAYRRGYDPEQVDRYVADQQRRLDEATTRASEAERRLAAAVGQLRELHRRVAVLESEDRSPQAPALDTLGERVQRVLQEAWEGAYALRQDAERDVADLRERAAGEAEAVLEAARSKARAMDEATERRRQAFLQRIEEDRNRALAQITYLHDQRRVALGELVKVKEVIEATVGKATFPTSSRPGDDPERPDAGPDEDLGEPAPRAADEVGREAPPAPPARSRDEAPGPRDDPRPTLPVHHLGMVGDRRRAERAERGRGGPERAGYDEQDATRLQPVVGPGVAQAFDELGLDDEEAGEPTEASAGPPGGVFDFEAEQP